MDINPIAKINYRKTNDGVYLLAGKAVTHFHASKSSLNPLPRSKDIYKVWPTMNNEQPKSRHNSIAIKLLALVLLITVVITLIGGAISIYVNYQQDMKFLHSRLDQVKVSVLPAISSSLWSFDEEQLKVQVNSLLDVDDVVKVSIDWHDWNNKPRSLTVGDLPEASATSSETLVKNFPLVYRGDNDSSAELGTMILYASLDSVNNNLLNRTRLMVLLEGAQALVLAVLLLWLVRQKVIRHLEAIAEYARNQTLSNLDKSLSLDRKPSASGQKDELDDMVDAFNQMSSSLLSDIYARQQIEQALREEKREKLESRRQKTLADSANRAKSQFLATMSHEIRTPMNGVIGMVELLRDTPLTRNQSHYVEVIYRSGLSLLDIINDILDYSKIEVGKLTLENAPLDLEMLIEDSLQLFGGRAAEKNVEMIADIAVGSPKMVSGDATRVRQVLINLLSNAYKFTDQGQIYIGARAVECDEQGKCKMLFTVQDTGIGISQEATETIFHSFNQADNSTTRKYGGTGLGLAICKRITELMGGEIGVESSQEPNQSGSRFWFTIVFDRVAESKLSDYKESVLLGKRLLIVAKNRQLLSMLRVHAQSWQMEVLTATSQTNAETLLQEFNQANNPFDLVIIDTAITADEGKSLADFVVGLNADVTRIISLCSPKAALSCKEEERQGIELCFRKPVTAWKLKDRLVECCTAGSFETDFKSQVSKDPAVDLSGLKILVAEDNHINQMVIQGLLGKAKGVPEFADNGVAAVSAVKGAECPYDLILMDCEMPELDGFDATRQIRNYEREHGLSATPIAALTAHALEEHRAAVFACGMDYYLTKPMTFASLEEMLQSLGLVASAHSLVEKPRLLRG